MKKLRFILFLIGLQQVTYSQIKEVSFTDGTKIDFELLESNTDKAKRHAVRISLGFMGISYQYVDPKKFEVTAGASLDGSAFATGLISFYSFDKDISIPLPLKTVALGHQSSITYNIEGETLKSSIFVGFHGGVRHYFFDYVYDFTGTAIIGGIGRFKTRHAKYFVADKTTGRHYKVNLTTRSAFYFDAMYFAGINWVPNEKPAKFGGVVYWEGSQYKSRKGRSGAGLCWQLGGGIGPHRGALIMLGLGLSF